MKYFLNTKGNKTTYHQRNREKKLNPAKEYYKNNIIQNYLTKKYKESMEEIDLKICLKKINKD